MLGRVLDVCRADFSFDGFEEVNPYFKRVINVFKQMNYSGFQSSDYEKYAAELEEILAERRIA